MLETERKKFIFKTKEIWFADKPFDLADCASAIFYDCRERGGAPGFREEIFNTLVIDLSQDQEKIWKNMDKSSCRYCIKRANREGIEIRINQDFDEFTRLDKNFREAKGLSAAGDFKKIYRKNGVLFTARYRQEVIGGQFYLTDDKTMRWLIGSSKRLQADRDRAILIGCGNRLILWEAIKYAQKNGLKEFDFGGCYTGDADQGKKQISDFKMSFGGKLTTRYLYRKNYSKLFGLLFNVKKYLPYGKPANR
jgi:hypothetical protein